MTLRVPILDSGDALTKSGGDVPSGIYHIRVVTGTQDVYVEKLIVK